LLFKNIFIPLQKFLDMKCPKCSSEEKVKSGFTKGKQRYKCKNCGCNYSVEIKSTAKPLSKKKQALHLYLAGLGFRPIGRFLNVSNVTVLNWIRSFGLQEKEHQSKIKEIKVVEIDEMCTYIRQKRTAGYRLLLIDMEKDSSTSLLAIGVQKPEKNCDTKLKG
jgi:transposase-like protein